MLCASGFVNTSFSVIKNALERHLSSLRQCFHKWHLKLCLPRTVCSVFYLANRCANATLSIKLDGTFLMHDSNPKYLGVIPIRSLTLNSHIKQVAVKTSAHVNLLKRPAGTGWGVDLTPLAYSTAEVSCTCMEF